MKKKENGWLLRPKNNVLSTVFSYAGLTRSMEEATRFGTKKSLTLPSSANNYFISLRDETDEAIYTYSGEFLRYFTRKSIGGGRHATLNQNFKFIISEEMFIFISTELSIIGII